MSSSRIDFSKTINWVLLEMSSELLKIVWNVGGWNLKSKMTLHLVDIQSLFSSSNAFIGNLEYRLCIFIDKLFSGNTKVLWHSTAPAS
jgi:hypothetical protein